MRRGNRTSFTWDGDGRQTGTSDALGNLITYQYDAASRRVVRIDGRGLLTSYVYDAASRLIGQQYQDGTRATMTYDADSRRTVLSDWTGLYTSAYDPDSRVSSVVNPAGIAITYAYDAVGQRATMAQPTGTFTYVFDPAGRISNLTNPEGQVTSWSYDASSRVTAQLLANGVRVSNTYDNADRLLLLANLGSGSTTLSSFAYTYNPVGNRTQVVEVDGSVVTWSYDPTYQLTNERRSGANSLQYHLRLQQLRRNQNISSWRAATRRVMGGASWPSARGVVPRRFGAWRRIPEPRVGQLRDLESEAGHSGPASTPVLAPGSALGVLLSRALSSAQANRDCRCTSARRQSPDEVVSFSFGQTQRCSKVCSRRARLRSLLAWLLAKTK